MSVERSAPLEVVPPEPSFHTAMAHFYRGEMQRMTTWRTRLDMTSHWAILLTIGMTTSTLGSGQLPHYVMLLSLAVDAIFMLMEARRYQRLHHSKWRVELLERNYFAGQLLPELPPVEPRWREELTADLRQPQLTLPLLRAARLRLRRTYLLLFYFVTAVWLTKLFVHPASPTSAGEYLHRFILGALVPGWLVAAGAALFLLGCTLFAVLSPSEAALERWTQQVAAQRDAVHT